MITLSLQPLFQFQQIISSKAINLKNEKQFIVVTLLINYEAKNIVLGWTKQENQIPNTLQELLDSGSKYDVNSYLSQRVQQKVFIDKNQLEDLEQMQIQDLQKYAVVIDTDIDQRVKYEYSLDVKSNQKFECPCEDSTKCVCEGHGMIRCLKNQIGSKCERESNLLEFKKETYQIKAPSFFHFDINQTEKNYQVDISSIDASIKFETFAKFYNSNSSVIPFKKNSKFTTTSNDTMITIVPTELNQNGPLYYNRILIKLQKVDYFDFEVMINLTLTDPETDNKLQKRDRRLAEQNRVQRRRNQQRMNTTMGDEDLKKYLPEVLYKSIKDKLLRITKQQDVGTCIVCLCEFEEDEYIRSTYCKHIFHSNCLTDWMKKNESCPYCRAALNKDNVLEKFEKHKNNSLMWLEQSDEQQIDTQMQGEQQEDKGQVNNLAEINKQVNGARSQVQIDNEEEMITYQKSTQELKNTTELPKLEQRKSQNPSKRQSIAIQDEKSKQNLINPPATEHKQVDQDQEQDTLNEKQQQIPVTVKISEKTSNGSQIVKKSGIRLNHQTSIESPLQFTSTTLTPLYKDNNGSTLDLKGIVIIQSNDSILIDQQTPSQGNIMIQTKKSQFQNNQLNKIKNNEDLNDNKMLNSNHLQQNFSMDSKLQGNDFNTMNSDEQAEKLNIDSIQSARVNQDKVVGFSSHQALNQPQNSLRRNNTKKTSKFMNKKPQN